METVVLCECRKNRPGMNNNCFKCFGGGYVKQDEKEKSPNSLQSNEEGGIQLYLGMNFKILA